MNRYSRAYLRHLEYELSGVESDIHELHEELDSLDDLSLDDWWRSRTRTELEDDLEDLGLEYARLQTEIENTKSGEWDERLQAEARLKWYGGGKLPQSVASCEWWTIPLYPEVK